MEWDDRYNVGVPLIDEQHRQLFEHLGKLSDAMHAGDRQAVVATLDFLGVYVVEHFALEEREMLESKFPFAMTHKSAHAEFIKEFDRLKREYEASGPTPWLSIRVRRALIDWLKDHILALDQKLGRHLAKSGR